MARCNLVYIRSAPQRLGTDVVFYERLKALLEIGTPAATLRHDCLIDTGAVFSVFPEKIWKTFEKDVAWLYDPTSGVTMPDWLGKVTGLGAQPIVCRIGKIRFNIIELPLTLPTPTRSPVVEIIGKFPYDNRAFPQILLGLGGRALLDWNLVIDSAHARAWLEY